jgi:tetratricopeptide (TPR) repeat protein
MNHKSVWIIVALVTGIAAGARASAYWHLIPSRHGTTASPAQSLSKEILHLESKTKANPSSFQVWGQLASLYVKQARVNGETAYYERAEAAAKRSLGIFPKPNPTARLALAQVAAARHDFQQAITIAKEVSLESTSPVGAGSVLVTAYLAKGDFIEASREADRLVDAKPSLGTYGLRALVMAAMGRTPEAVEDFENALRVEDFGEEDESAWTRSLYARLLMRTGKIAEAEKMLDSALSLRPRYALALDLKGELALRKGDTERAVEQFTSALHESMQVAYLARLAGAKVINGDLTGGLGLLKQAEAFIRSELGAGGFGHRVELAKILIARAKLRTEGWRELVTEAAGLAGDELAVRKTTEARLVYAKACFELGRTKEAAGAIRDAFASGAVDAELFHEASLIEVALDNPHRAAFYARRALEVNPKFSPERSVEL